MKIITFIISLLRRTVSVQNVEIVTWHGKRVIKKSWRGKIHDTLYYNLKNEIFIARSLRAFSGIYIPKVFKIYDGRGRLVVLFEYIEGKLAGKFSTRKQLNILENIQKALLSVDIDSIPQMRKKAGIWFLLTIIPLTFLAIIKNKKDITLILKSIPVFFRGILFLMKEPVGLVHGDLHGNNILVSGEFFILDWAQSMKSYRLWELIAIVSTPRNDPKVRHYYWKQIRKIAQTKRLAVRTMLTYSTLFNLISKQDPETKRLYRSILKKTLSL